MAEPDTPAPETLPDVPLRTEVRLAIERAWEAAQAGGALPAAAPGTELPVVEVERPGDPAHGDLATSLALKLARPYRQPPLRIAEAIAAALREQAAGAPASPIAAVDVAAPGFLNLRLSDAALEQALDRILAAPASWGRVRAGTPRQVNVEFVSANPTGPLHIGNARGAFVGDLLCRVLEAAGHDVTREYYFNDFGAQVRNLGASVLAIRQGEPVPGDGYRGDYVRELADQLPAEVLEEAGRAEDRAWPVGLWASERVRAGIEASLARLGVRFDVWKSEGSLYAEGWVERAVERLRASGHLYSQDGALWFRSTDFGDDKDRVVRKSNGDFTYFGSDIGYVTEKFSRGFDHLIYIWGADHHGTVARLQNAAEAMGYPRADVEVLLIAWVRFVRDGREISMSKRAGEFITLDELLSEIGVDAARWFFGSRGHSSGIDFDIELAKRQSNENPVYYVQYAHARIASILRKAADAGLARADRLAGSGLLADASSPEAVLARETVRLPEVVEDAAAAEETQSITAYATQLATTFHAFYRDARVVDPADAGRSARRLALVEAARITLANALGLLGISAPESM
ncbi:MAG TPA: arginine--tRNA ligase [Candidatus Limnocylindrales bacterium]